MSDYRYEEISTKGVYEDGSSRLVHLEFRLPSGVTVGPSPREGGEARVVLTAPRDQDRLGKVEVDPDLLAQMADRFKGIGS